MTKLLKIEIAVLIVLVIVAIGIRTNDTYAPDNDILQQPDTSQATRTEITATEPTESMDPAETDPPETTIPPTEPPVVLTIGEDVGIQSQDYFVYDCGRENLMAASGPLEEKVWPASVTKLFTAYVALQYLDAETVVKAGSEVNMVASDSSIAYIKPGYKLTVAQLVEGLLLPSGNDAAYALAVAAARQQTGNSDLSVREALEHFVALMNTHAQELGMTGTHWANPDGYHDSEHYTSIGDLITIAKLALENELIMQCAGTAEDRVTYVSGEIANWHNTNQLINPASQYYCENAIGLKTGNTSYAGFCLLSAFEVEGEYIIVGAFKCLRPEDRFIDSLKLYNLVLEAFAQ